MKRQSVNRLEKPGFQVKSKIVSSTESWSNLFSEGHP